MEGLGEGLLLLLLQPVEEGQAVGVALVEMETVRLLEKVGLRVPEAVKQEVGEVVPLVDGEGVKL